MELKFAMLADYVTESREGKLIIAGEFDVINAPRTPATHPAMFFVARVEAAPSEGVNHKVRLAVVSKNGQPIMPATPDLDVKFVETGPGRPLRGQIIAGLGPTSFPTFGDFEFQLYVDGRLLAQVPLRLNQVQLKNN